MKFTDTEYDKLFKKLEYRFKNSGHELVDKIKDKKSLTDEDLKLLIRKLEYTYRKSEDELMKKIIELTGEPAVKFSNLKQQKRNKKKKILSI